MFLLCLALIVLSNNLPPYSYFALRNLIKRNFQFNENNLQNIFVYANEPFCQVICLVPCFLSLLSFAVRNNND